MNFQIKKSDYFILIIILSLGIFFAYQRGSNFSDGDAYSVILAYLNYFTEGIYNPSRGAYGHPIPELLIGFISYNFGTPISNVLCFSLFFFSILILFRTYFVSEKNIALFVLLIVSNSYLFLENTNSTDYPVAFFFFSLGLFFFKKKQFFFSYIFFGLSIASRANFLTFVYPIIFIYFFNEIKQKDFKNVLKSFFCVTIVGLFFYIPLFELHNYSLGFLDLPFIGDNNPNKGWYGGPKLSIESLSPRFFYKIYLLLGIYASIFFLFISFSILKKFNFLDKDNQILLFIIFINLFVFFFMPTKILIINPFIICLYIFLFKYLERKKIIIFIFLNFFQWFVSYQIVDITYKKQDVCFQKEAINYNFKFTINEGKLLEHLVENKNMNKCYSQFMGKYADNFEKGKPLKLSRDASR